MVLGRTALAGPCWPCQPCGPWTTLRALANSGGCLQACPPLRSPSGMPLFSSGRFLACPYLSVCLRACPGDSWQVECLRAHKTLPARMSTPRVAFGQCPYFLRVASGCALTSPVAFGRALGILGRLSAYGRTKLCPRECLLPGTQTLPARHRYPRALDIAPPFILGIYKSGCQRDRVQHYHSPTTGGLLVVVVVVSTECLPPGVSLVVVPGRPPPPPLSHL